MSRYRSTTLKLLVKHCPAALDFYDDGAPMERDLFAEGIAAHAVLQAIGEAANRRAEIVPPEEHRAIGDAVALALTTNGRSFDGTPEPPMSPEAAMAGRDVALAWSAENRQSSDARYEYGIAVDARWQRVPYDSAAARYTAILDVLEGGIGGDEEYQAEGYTVRDYKTAWSTTEAELDTLQMKGQAVLAAIAHPDSRWIRREVVNLRTRQTFEHTLWLDEEGLGVLAGWRRDLELLMSAADYRLPSGSRPYRAGAGCLGCPYVLRCPAAQALYSGTGIDGERESLAASFAVAQATRDTLAEMARAATDEGSITVPSGFVGTVAKAKRIAVWDAPQRIARAYLGPSEEPENWNEWDADNGRAIGMVKALQPGASNIEALAASLHQGKGTKPARTALVESLLTTAVTRLFGVHRGTGVDAAGVSERTAK